MSTSTPLRALRTSPPLAAARYSRTTLAPQAHRASFPGAVGRLLSTWNRPPALEVKSPLSGETSPQWKEATANPKSHSSSEGR